MTEVNQTLRESFHTPMGEILRSVSVAIADAQLELDKSALRVAEFMGGRVLLPTNTTEAPTVVDSRLEFGYTRGAGGTVEPLRLSALELGFRPAFYQFVDNVIELKIALRLAYDENRYAVATGTPVDGDYASTYGFEAEYASVIKTRLAPVPPPASLDGWLEERQLVAAAVTGAASEAATEEN